VVWGGTEERSRKRAKLKRLKPEKSRSSGLVLSGETEVPGFFSPGLNGFLPLPCGASAVIGVSGRAGYTKRGSGIRAPGPLF